jgi:hypothetical protein
MELLVGKFGKTESPQQYEKLLGELAKDYQPVGAAEHLEVERIAACWWKLGRAWRYENAQIAIAHTRVDEGRLVLLRPTALSELPASEYHARLDFLRRAEKEIEATGKISDELKNKIAADARFRETWTFVEKGAEAQLGEFLAHVSSENRPEPTNPDYSTKSLLENTRIALYLLERSLETIVNYFAKAVCEDAEVPEAEALDRLLRAEAAAERNLSRAIDRLERLQRRRKGETVPPPVNVRLTR